MQHQGLKGAAAYNLSVLSQTEHTISWLLYVSKDSLAFEGLAPLKCKSFA
jgi:hypothetical protein